ncbi:hypothetical protein [Lysinibacillus agricola]|uniref:hypothetical protein n=1 Tax=Lysinibacillus agricola TaxID=2590012 RepID=UPI003C2458CC
MQSLAPLTDLQRKFLVQINAYHQTIFNDCDGKYRLRYIIDLAIDKATQSIIVTFKNNDVFRYNRYGTINKLK